MILGFALVFTISRRFFSRESVLDKNCIWKSSIYILLEGNSNFKVFKFVSNTIDTYQYVSIQSR